MAFTRKRSFRDWFQEMFVRQGYFSLRCLPTNAAERELAEKATPPKDLTRLNLDTNHNKSEK
jgi:hypothetical protein